MVSSLVEHSRSEAIQPERALPMHLAIGDAGFLAERACVASQHEVKVVGPIHLAPEQLPPAALRLEDLFRDHTRRMLRELNLAPGNPSLLVGVGLSYLNQGLVAEARQYFDRAVTADPGNVEARFNLARCELATGNASRGLQLCRALGDEQPGNESVHVTLADIYGRLGMREEAISTLTAVLSRSPQSTVALYNRGVQYLLLRRLDRAIADFRAASRSNVRFGAAHNSLGVCYLVKGAAKKAVRHLTVAARLDKTPEVKKNLVRALLEADRAEDALGVLQEHSGAFPRDWESKELLAEVYRRVGSHSAWLRTLFEVRRAYTENDADKKSVARVENNLGVAYSQVGNHDKAREHYEVSLALSEGIPIPFHNLARQYLSQGRIQKARKLFDEHCQRFRGDPLTLAMGGRLALLQDDLSRAEAMFRQAMDADPESMYGYMGLSSILGDYQGNHAAAVEVTLRALEIIPGHHMLLNNLAYDLLMSGNISEARRVLHRVTGHDDDVYLTATRGLLLLREGKVAEAEQLYNKAARLANGDLRTLVEQKKRVEVARYWYQAGRRDKARAFLNSALSLAPRQSVYARQAAELVRMLQSSGS